MFSSVAPWTPPPLCIPQDMVSHCLGVTDAHAVAPGFHVGPGALDSGPHALFDLAIFHIVR